MDLPLQLDVSINGQATHLIAGFSETMGDLASSPTELAELGIELSQDLISQRLVRLRDISGLAFHYDRSRQTIDLLVGDDIRRKHVIDASGRKPLMIDRSSGAVLNYALVGSLNDDALRRSGNDPLAGQGMLAAHLDGRIITPRGAFELAAIGRANRSAVDETLTRLDTAWTTEKPETLMRWRAGDTISGGLQWTRPMRMAGVQVQRSFELRPDLITTPLPIVGGTAAVPSTVDVYINNVRSFSQAVPAGPFSITNLPVMTGAGQARIVVRDASGRETLTEQAFLSPVSMLAPGLFDYSLEAGFARLGYGARSNDYDDAPVASASARFGISDRLTVEAHAEGGKGLANVGIGALTPLKSFAILSTSLSASRYADRLAAKSTVGVESHWAGLSFAVQSQRAWRGYRDLISITGDDSRGEDRYDLLSSMALRSMDLVSVGIPVTATGGQINLALVSATREDGDRQRLTTASYTQRLTDSVNIHASGFHDIDADRLGVFAGLSMSLGGGHHVSIGVSQSHKGAEVTTDYVKAQNMTPGSVGWRTTVSRGNAERVGAQVNWTGSHARVEASALQSGNSAQATLVVTGAVTAAGDGAFLSNRIDDSFAVVDVGAPGVRVLHENREVGVTDQGGRLLVTGLRSMQENRIAIDPLTLPLDVEAPPSQRNVVPASRAGVVLSMQGRRIEAAAVIVLRDAQGIVLPPGATGRHTGTGEAFVVGYDGEAYVRGLGVSNTVTVLVDGRPCTAHFAFKTDRALPGRIDGVICR